MRLSLSPVPNEPYPAPGINAPQLITPRPGDTFSGSFGGDTISLFARIPAGAPAVTKVEFFQGATKLGEATAAPWQFRWDNVTQGNYSLKARTTYADTTQVDSSYVPVTVTAPNTFDPTTIPQLALWADPTDNASITLSGSNVQTMTRFRDSGKFSTDLTQATAGSQPKLGRLRGRQALFVGGNSTSTERLVAPLVASVPQPLTGSSVSRAIGLQSAGTDWGTGGVARVSTRGTAYPRTLRVQAATVVDDSYPVSKPYLKRVLFSGSNSEIANDGVVVHSSAALGTTGLTTDVSWPGLNSGGAEPGARGDFAIFVGTVSAPNVALWEAYQLDKWRTNNPAATICFIGDSQTHGFGTTNGSWRNNVHDFFSRAKTCGRWVEEIGFKPEGGVRFFEGDVHDGVDGKGVVYHSNTTPGAGGIPTLFGSANQWTPDICVLFMGENNAVNGVGGESFVAGNGAGSTRQIWRDLVTTAMTLMPNSIFVIVNLCADPISGTNTNVITLNSTWFADADTSAAALGRTVIHVDVNTALGGPTYVAANFQADGHIDQNTGAPLVAAVMIPAIVEAVSRLPYAA